MHGIGIGYLVCECKTIYCLYCQKCFTKRKKALIHFVNEHKSQNNKFKCKSFNRLKEKYTTSNVMNLGNNFLGAVIPVKSGETHHSIQKKIKLVTNIPISKQLIPGNLFAIHNGTKVLKDQYLNGHLLKLKRKDEKNKIQIVTLRGEAIKIEIDESVSFSKLKRICEGILGYNRDEIIFMVNGNQMNNSTKLKSIKNWYIYHYYLIEKSIYYRALEGLTIQKDYQILFQQRELTDLKIDKYGVHSLLIESRTESDPLRVKKILENGSYPIESFLQWVYGKYIKFSLIEPIFRALNLNYDLYQIDFVDTLKKLYHSGNSKDFKIISNDQMKIPVHSLILHSRSQLFRGLFLLKETDFKKDFSQVKDFSDRNSDTLKVFIKYLYYGKLSFKNFSDPYNIQYQLENAQEYYQLNKGSFFLYSLTCLRKKLLSNNKDY
ncbi:speckle-type poz protein [Anaeramoeba flamelloides]|uniref:Speckle-type poz protein n=1 Tax=Anaeramoeba flamelloides TaxID=1746091 RepID=A0ABQ8Y050_9EUKA|nr:speckle-type poz protein [Anaeramoeba flamelloides]